MEKGSTARVTTIGQNNDNRYSGCVYNSFPVYPPGNNPLYETHRPPGLIKGPMKNRVGGERATRYLRHPVAADGDCAYTAFGITRDEALSQLLTHLEPVKELLQPAIREALLINRFYRYLIADKVLRFDVTHEMLIQQSDEYLSITAVCRSYVRYDVRDKHIDAGYAHPGVLQALSHIRGTSLRIWRLGGNAALRPNRGPGFDYFEYTPPHEERPRPVDILFVNNNHFELLESSEEGHRVSEGDIPAYSHDSSWPPKVPSAVREVQDYPERLPFPYGSNHTAVAQGESKSIGQLVNDFRGATFYPEGAVKNDSRVEINTIVVPGGVGSLLNNHYQDDLSKLVKTYRVVCIHGMGGAGKSTLAQAEALKKEIPYSIRFQIAADSDDALFAGLIDLYGECCGAEKRHLLQKEIRQEKDPNKQRTKLLMGLRTVLQNTRWSPSLLLLDNCQKETPFLRQVIDTLTDTRCLITTRDEHLLAAYSISNNPTVERLSLNQGWSLEDRLQFLEEDLGELTERQALVNYLPFPLALKIATQTIRYLQRNPRRKYTCERYLSEIRAGIQGPHVRKALAFISEDMTQRQTTVLKKSMRLIQSKAAKILLQFLGHLSPLPIPYEIVNDYFERFFSQESEEIRMDLLDEGLRQLQAMSLIDTEMQAGSIEALTIHELIQDIARREFPLSRKAKKLELKVMKIMLNTFLAWIRIKKHLFSDEGRRQRVRDAGLHLETLLRNIDSNKPYIGETYRYLGNAYRDLGDPNKHKACLERALKIKKAYYGENHVEVAVTLNNLGNAYGALGDPNKQKELLENALTVLGAFYGENHLNVANTLHSLGNAHGALGDPNKQKEFLERALTIQKAAYGENHVNVARTLHSLGNAHGALGDPNKQKAYLERVLTIEKAAYGEDHVYVASTLHSLGNAYGALGDPNKQKVCLDCALKIKKVYYGEDHVEVAGTLHSLGNAYGALGDLNKQKELLERALTIKKAAYGEDHLYVAITLTHLGDAYRALKQYDQAINFLQRALAINEKFYGLDHYRLSVTLTYLGDARRDSGEYKASLDSLERALAFKITPYGEANFEVGRTYHSLASTFQSLGRSDEAENHFLGAYTIFKKHYGENHAHTKEVYEQWQRLRQSKQGKPKIRLDIFHRIEDAESSAASQGNPKAMGYSVNEKNSSHVEASTGGLNPDPQISRP